MQLWPGNFLTIDLIQKQKTIKNYDKSKKILQFR